MKLVDVTAERLRKVDREELSGLHFRTHLLFNGWKKADKSLDIQLVKKVHDLVVSELVRREAEKKDEHASPISIKEALAPIHPSGERTEGNLITLEDLPEFKDFYTQDVTVYLTGGIVNNGESANDVDFLIRLPEDTPLAIRRPIEFRIERQFRNANVRGRLQFCYDTYHGPFTDAIPLYRQKFERINPEMSVILAAEKVEKETTLRQAEQSKKEDELKMFRFFYPLKTSLPAVVLRKDFENDWRFDGTVEEIKDLLPLVVEEKYDGLRIVMFKDGEKAKAYTDGASDVTDRLPQLVAELEAIKKPTSFIIDSELEYWLDGEHQPREELAGLLLGKEPIDEQWVVANVFEILWQDGEDLHERSWIERKKLLDEFPFAKSELGFTKTKSMLNRAPSLVARTPAELKKHLEKVVKAEGSEGAIVKQVDGKYSLAGTSTVMSKIKKYASAFGIVYRRNETATKGVYNYDYAIRVPKEQLDPKAKIEIKGEQYSKSGTSYATTEKLNPGDVFRVTFHTFNIYEDPETGFKSGRFYEPVFDGKVPERKEPSSIAEAEAIAKDAGLLGRKKGRQNFSESFSGVDLVFLGTRGMIEEKAEGHEFHSGMLVKYDGSQGLLDFGENLRGKLAKLRPKWIALTHAHPDHVKGLEGEEISVPVYMTKETSEKLSPEKYPMKERKIIRPGGVYPVVEGVKLEVVKVKLSTVAPTVGYKISIAADENKYVIGFFPNVAEIKEEELKDVDIYVGDGSGVTRPIFRTGPEEERVGHASMKQQLQWCQNQGIHTAVFIHQGKGPVEMDDRKILGLLETAFPNKEIIIPKDGDLLSVNTHAVKDAMYLTPPHGELIYNGEKKIVVKSKEFDALNKVLFLASDLVYGTIRLGPAYKISLKEFETLRNKHRISDAERKKWWPDKRELWAYDVVKFWPWHKPRRYQYIRGPQVIIKNLKLLESKSFEVIEASNEEIQEVAYSFSKRPFANAIVNRLPATAKTIFDPMCGTSAVLMAAARKGLKVTANDVNPYAYRFSKGIFEGEILNAEDVDALLAVKEKRGWFTNQHKAMHPVSKSIREWVDGLMLHIESCFSGKKMLTARAVAVAFLGRFFGGRHSSMRDAYYYYYDKDKCRQMLRASISEVNRLVEQVGGKGIVTCNDAFKMQIPEADVIFFDPPQAGGSPYSRIFTEYKTRNSVLLQKEFRQKEPTREQIVSLLGKLANKCSTIVVCTNDQTDWESEVKKFKANVTKSRVHYFRRIRNPAYAKTIAGNRVQEILLAEQEDPYLRYPDEKKTYKFVAQHHWRGKSCHADLRMESVEKETLIGWTLNDLIKGVVKEPVLTLQDAREKERNPGKYFKINWKTGEWAQRLKKGAVKPVNVTIMTQKKAPEPIEWLDFQGVVEPGEVGATKRYPGVFVITDKGTAEYGFQQPWSHEYFFHGKGLNYRVVFRQLRAEEFGESRELSQTEKRLLMLAESLMDEELEREGIKHELLEALPQKYFDDSFVVEVKREICPLLEQKILPPSEEKTIGVRWFAIKPVVQMPYILSDEAVKKKRLPPLGKSALPREIRKAIPEPLRYWNAKTAKEALLIRDELVELIKKDEIKIPVQEAANKNFALKYHWYSKVGEKKRAGATEWHFDLFLLDGKKQHFELDLDPLEAEVISGHFSAPEYDHDEKAEGFIVPGQVGNPHKERGSWIESIDEGEMTLLEKTPVFMKIRFKGEKFKGVWTFERESPTADFWKVARSKPAPGEEK